MSGIRQKVENSLNESRILALVLQVLVGFELESVFEKAFWKMPPAWRLTRLAALTLLLAGLAGALTPVAHDRLCRAADEPERLVKLANICIAGALACMAAALGLDFFLGASVAAGAKAGWPAGLLAGGFAAGFWFAIPLWKRRG